MYEHFRAFTDVPSLLEHGGLKIGAVIVFHNDENILRVLETALHGSERVQILFVHRNYYCDFRSCHYYLLPPASELLLKYLGSRLLSRLSANLVHLCANQGMENLILLLQLPKLRVLYAFWQPQ